MNDTLEAFINNRSPESRTHLERLGIGAAINPAEFAREHRIYCHTKSLAKKRRRRADGTFKLVNLSLNQHKLRCGHKLATAAIKAGYFIKKN